MFLTNWNLTRLTVILSIVCLTALLGQSSFLYGQSSSKNSSSNQASNEQQSNPEPTKLTLTIDMDANKLAVLRQTGSLQVGIPQAYQGRVDAVRIKREVSFKSDDFALNNSVDKLGNTVTVSIDDVLLDQLDFQPIKAKIYYSGFSSVTLTYTKREAGDPVGLAERENKPTIADSTRVFARVDDKRGLYGWMTGLAKLKLNSEFGEVFIDSTDIAGIKFNANGSGGVAIRLHSGATISGYVDFDEITMKCSWGTQKLSLKELDSVVSDRSFQFASDPYHPGRWSFKTDLAKPPPQPVFDETVPGFVTPIRLRSLPYNP